MHPYRDDHTRGYFENYWRRVLKGALDQAAYHRLEASLTDDDPEAFTDHLLAAQACEDAARQFQIRLKGAREGWCVHGGGGSTDLDPSVKAALEARGELEPVHPEDSAVLQNRTIKTPAGRAAGAKDAKCVICGCTDSRACSPPCSWLSVDREAGWGICSASKCAMDRSAYGLLRNKVRLHNAIVRRAD